MDVRVLSSAKEAGHTRSGNCGALEVTNADKFIHRRKNGGGQMGTQPGAPHQPAAVTRGAGLGMSLRLQARGSEPRLAWNSLCTRLA